MNWVPHLNPAVQRKCGASSSGRFALDAYPTLDKPCPSDHFDALDVEDYGLPRGGNHATPLDLLDGTRR